MLSAIYAWNISLEYVNFSLFQTYVSDLTLMVNYFQVFLFERNVPQLSGPQWIVLTRTFFYSSLPTLNTKKIHFQLSLMMKFTSPIIPNLQLTSAKQSEIFHMLSSHYQLQMCIQYNFHTAERIIKGQM